MYMNHYLSEPCVNCGEKHLSQESDEPKRAFEFGLSLICIDIHDVSKFNWMPLACTLNVCMSFPGMMQGDNENIKVNLVFTPCS